MKLSRDQLVQLIEWWSSETLEYEALADAIFEAESLEQSYQSWWREHYAEDK